jgi:hypothetical protein
MCKLMKQIAPQGFISTKNFMDLLIKLSQAGNITELLPDSYLSGDSSAFQKLVYLMDPFETGFINWQTFLLLQCKIHPCTIADISAVCSLCTDSWDFSKVEYDNLQFWLQPDYFCTPTTFNRSAKLAGVIFGNHIINLDIFSNKDATTGEEIFDARTFLLNCCLDDIPCNGLEKAFAVISKDELCGSAELYEMFHFRFDSRIKTMDDPYPMESFEELLKCHEGGVIDFSSFRVLCESKFPSFLISPLFKLVDLSLSSQSRPNSSDAQ